MWRVAIFSYYVTCFTLICLSKITFTCILCTYHMFSLLIPSSSWYTIFYLLVHYDVHCLHYWSLARRISIYYFICICISYSFLFFYRVAYVVLTTRIDLYNCQRYTQVRSLSPCPSWLWLPIHQNKIDMPRSLVDAGLETFKSRRDSTVSGEPNSSIKERQVHRWQATTIVHSGFTLQSFVFGICLIAISNQLSARQRRGQLSIAHNPQEVSPLEESREVKDKAWHSCVLNWSRSTDDGLWRAEIHEPRCLKLLLILILILYSRIGLIWGLRFQMQLCLLVSLYFGLLELLFI